MNGNERRSPFTRRPVYAGEVADLDDQFDACDTDGDRRIDFAEFSRLLERLGSTALPGQRRDRFDAIDSDGDGTIDRSEFMDWLQSA